MKKTLLAATLVVALALGAGNALAQSTADPHQHDQPTAESSTPGAGAQSDPMMQMMSGMMGMMKMMHGQGGMPGMGMSPMMGIGMTDHVEGRIAFLHAELKIADSQEKLWTAFADVLRETSDGVASDAMHEAAASTGSGIAAALKARQALLETRLVTLKKLTAALEPLYTALSDEQKKLADELIGRQIGMGSSMMGSGMMPGMARQHQGKMPMQGSNQ